MRTSDNYIFSTVRLSIRCDVYRTVKLVRLDADDSNKSCYVRDGMERLEIINVGTNIFVDILYRYGRVPNFPRG